MRFLVVAKQNTLPPPEMVVAMIDAIGPWQQEWAKQQEQIWGSAGQPGGGGILNVDSWEELDAVMTEFPFAPFSDIQITAIVDLPAALERGKAMILSMMPPA